MDIIQKLKRVNKFKGKSDINSGFNYVGEMYGEIFFPFSKRQYVEITDLDQKIVFFDGINEFNFSLTNTYFKNYNIFHLDIKILDEVAELFNLKKIHEGKYFYLTPDQCNDYNKFSALIKHFHGRTYFLLYATRRTREAQSPAEDMYGDDILYVHGIWEVELSEEFKRKLYPEL